MTKILNPDETIEIVQQSMNYNKQNLDLANMKIEIFNEHKITTQMSFKKAIEELSKWCGPRYNGKISLVCRNLFDILFQIKQNLDISKKHIDSGMIELVKLSKDLEQAFAEQENLITDLEQDLERKQIVIDTLKEDKTDSKIRTLEGQVKTLQLALMGKSHTDISDIIDDSEQLEQESEEIIEKPTNESQESENMSKRQRLSQAHKDMINIMQGEGMYPLHKQPFLEQVKDKYIELWEFIAPKYRLEEYPIMIDNLEKFKDKPDDYLDDIVEIK